MSEGHAANLLFAPEECGGGDAELGHRRSRRTGYRSCAIAALLPTGSKSGKAQGFGLCARDALGRADAGVWRAGLNPGGVDAVGAWQVYLRSIPVPGPCLCEIAV